MEYDSENKALVVLGINDRFIEEIGSTRTECMVKVESSFNCCEDENKQLVVSMLDEAIKTGKRASCETMANSQKTLNEYQGYKLWARLLVTDGYKHFLYITIENITEVKRMFMEKEKAVEAYGYRS